MSLQVAAGNILQRAVELDGKKRFTEALICYQEGLQVLVDVLKEQSGEKRTYLRSKIEEYMKRAETIKSLIENMKKEGNFHEQIHVENDSTGYSYNNVFSRFLDHDVRHVQIEDPYIRNHHQCQNFVRFSELLVKKCNNLLSIELITVNSGGDQSKWLREIQQSLLECKVKLVITYSTTLHDRQIMLSTGWIIKIGRGLDYFKPSQGKFCVGCYDYDLRQCHETTLDIFHSNNVTNR